MYRRTTYDCGQVVDVQCYYPGNFGAPGMKRSERQKRTPEDIARQNHTNRIAKVRRLILCNFQPGDWHLTLNYRRGERPETTKEAKANLSRFLGAIRKELKKYGIPFRYIGVTEIGKKGQALHHHLIIENIQSPNIVDLVRRTWTLGNTYWSDMYEEGEYEQLASYIVKKETKVDGWSTYTRSRNNLKEPVRKSKTLRRCWPEDPKIPKGYELIKGSLYDGVNPVTGFPYRHYSIRKVGNHVEYHNIHRDHNSWSSPGGSRRDVPD